MIPHTVKLSFTDPPADIPEILDKHFHKGLSSLEMRNIPHNLHQW